MDTTRATEHPEFYVETLTTPDIYERLGARIYEDYQRDAWTFEELNVALDSLDELSGDDSWLAPSKREEENFKQRLASAKSTLSITNGRMIRS